jgi:hypothetical protein
MSSEAPSAKWAAWMSKFISIAVALLRRDESRRTAIIIARSDSDEA